MRLSISGKGLNNLIRSHGYPILLQKKYAAEDSTLSQTCVICLPLGQVYVEKQPVAWEDCCVEYWCEKTRKCISRWTGRRDITEKLLKTALTSINQQPFPTYLQQMTLKTSRQKYRNDLWMKVKLLSRVENIMAKGEITHEQFLLLLWGFQKSSAADASIYACGGEGLKKLWQKEKLLIMSNSIFCHNV